MSKPVGWRKEPARHSLAARGVRTGAWPPTTMPRRTDLSREADLKRLLDVVRRRELEMGRSPEKHPELLDLGYGEIGPTEYLNCDEVVDLIAMPLLKSQGYNDAHAVVGRIEFADGTEGAHAWIELREYIFDPTAEQLGTNTWTHPKLIAKTDPLAKKYLRAKERTVCE